MLCVLYVPPTGQSETWAVVWLIVQFTKFVVCCLSSNSSLYGLGFNPRVHKQFHGAIFLSCFPSAISLVLLSSLDLPFVVLGPESHLATYFMWVCPCLGPSDWGVKECSGEWPYFLGTTHVLQSQRKVPVPLWFPVTATSVTMMAIALGLGHEKREKREKEEFSPIVSEH